MRLAAHADIEQLAILYRDTILTVNIRHYSAEQTEAWAGRYTNVAGWNDKIAQQYFIVEEENNIITGFCSLTEDGHVDMLFVHNQYQGKGIARRLLKEIEQKARERELPRLTTDASKTARPIFEHYGFKVVAEQTVLVDGVALNNFKMQKELLSV